MGPPAHLRVGVGVLIRCHRRGDDRRLRERRDQSTHRAIRHLGSAGIRIPHSFPCRGSRGRRGWAHRLLPRLHLGWLGGPVCPRSGVGAANGARGMDLRSLRDPQSSRGRPSRKNRATRPPSLEPGFEPPSPFGRSLSRRVQYQSANAPERIRPSVARWASAGAWYSRMKKSWDAFAKHQIGAPGFEPGTSASRTQRSTGLSHAPNNKGAHSRRHCNGRGGIRTHETLSGHCVPNRPRAHRPDPGPHRRAYLPPAGPPRLGTAPDRAPDGALRARRWTNRRGRPGFLPRRPRPEPRLQSHRARAYSRRRLRSELRCLTSPARQPRRRHAPNPQVRSHRSPDSAPPTILAPPPPASLTFPQWPQDLVGSLECLSLILSPHHVGGEEVHGSRGGSEA